jgi:hypothetical protein
MPANNIPDSQSNRYDSDFLVNNYSRMEGLLALPVMGLNEDGSPKQPKIIRVHSPVGIRHVRFAYKKRGSPPVFPRLGVDTPSRTGGKVGDRFLGGDLAMANSVGGNENQIDWSVSGEYTYAQVDVRGSGDNFQCGRRPYKNALLDATMANAAVAIAGGLGLAGIQIVDKNSFANPPVGTRAADASGIDFTNPDYAYFDYTELASAFESGSLII